MNISGENIENFAKVFGLINEMYPTRVVHIEKDNVIPLNQRAKLMFAATLFLDPESHGYPPIKALEDLGSYPSSYYFICEPKEVFKNKSENSIRILRRRIRYSCSETGTIFIQTEGSSQSFANSEIILTEQLVELLTMLYFRGKGYMVQRSPKTYNGVDDKCIWRKLSGGD